MSDRNRERRPERLRGTVMSFIRHRGFGFLKRDDGLPDTWFSAKAFVLAKLPEPTVGDRIEYEIETNPFDGRERAGRLRALTE